MNINRYNYEEFFMLYVDNELSPADKKQVEAFVAQHADLVKELQMLQQTVFMPDENASFINKNILLQPEHGDCQITEQNYDTYFVLYADNELNNLEKEAVELFVYKHPQYQTDFELIQKTKLSADNSIVFENKESLYRYEKDEKVIYLRWWKMAVAVLLLLLAGVWWMNRSDSNKNEVANVTETPAVNNNTGVEGKKATQPEAAHTQNNIAIIAQSNSQSIAAQNNTANKLANNKRSSSISKAAIAKSDDVIKAPKTPIANTINNINTIIEAKPINNELAVSKEPIIDKPMKIETNETANFQFASNNSNDEPLYIANTSINKKNALRGLLRKASRVIEKGGNLVEGNGKKGILIGNIEIGLK